MSSRVLWLLDPSLNVWPLPHDVRLAEHDVAAFVPVLNLPAAQVVQAVSSRVFSALFPALNACPALQYVFLAEHLVLAAL